MTPKDSCNASPLGAHGITYTYTYSRRAVDRVTPRITPAPSKIVIVNLVGHDHHPQQKESANELERKACFPAIA